MKKAFAVPVILIIAFVILGFFALPQYKSFKQLKEKLAKKQDQLVEMEDYLVGLEHVLTTVEKYQESLEKIKAALPEEVSLASLLNYFQKASSESGLLLKNVGLTGLAVAGTGKSETEQNSETPEPNVQETRFNLELLGTYPSLKSFVQVLEKSARLIEVENISVDIDDDQEKTGLLRFSILIKVYSQQ